MENNLATFLRNVKNYDYIMTLHLNLDIKITKSYTFADLLLEALTFTKNLQKFELSNSLVHLEFFYIWLKTLNQKIYYNLSFIRCTLDFDNNNDFLSSFYNYQKPKFDINSPENQQYELQKMRNKHRKEQEIQIIQDKDHQEKEFLTTIKDIPLMKLIHQGPLVAKKMVFSQTDRKIDECYNFPTQDEEEHIVEEYSIQDKSPNYTIEIQTVPIQQVSTGPDGKELVTTKYSFIPK
jgi:hypothetical protein